MRESGVYSILNTVNGKRYVGSAICLKDRFYDHRKRLRAGRHHSIKLQRAWNKHGESVFVFETLEIVDAAQLIAREQHWIDHHNAACPDRGYNISPTAGSQLGLKHSEKTRAQISASKTGYKHSAESRANMGAGRMGVKRSARSIELQRARLKGNKYFAGKKHSEETKARMSAAAKLRGISAATRAAQRAAVTGVKWSAETRAKQLAARKGRIFTAETCRKISEALKARGRRLRGESGPGATAT